MAEHPHVELIQRGFTAFQQMDLEGIDALLHDDVVWHFPGTHRFAGTKNGKGEVLDLFGQLYTFTDGTVANEVHDILANDRHGVALVTNKAERKGKTYENLSTIVFHISDGQAAEVWALVEDHEVMNAFYED
jgi:uncharacterized protein